MDTNTSEPFTNDRQSWILYAEGVNFSATLYDTNDLSTNRGGGLTLLWLNRAVEEALDLSSKEKKDEARLYAGASQCAYKFEGTKEEAVKALEGIQEKLKCKGSQGEPYQHMQFVTGMVEIEEGGGYEQEEKALSYAKARALAQQGRNWTVPMIARNDVAKGYDVFDRKRPATKKRPLPPGKILDGRYEEKESDKNELSDSVFERREFGRKMRQKFYEEYTGEETQYLVTNDFGSIVTNPPDGLPLSLEGKIAVIYIDGNKFGVVKDDVKNIKYFSSELTTCQTKFLKALLDWFDGGFEVEEKNERFFVHEDIKNENGNVETKHARRLETLLWGGDEMMFVMPSWLAFDFAEFFFNHTEEWEIKGNKLTHSMGITICHYKAPIRLAKTVAKDAAETVKDTLKKLGEQKNGFSIDVFESVALSDCDLSEYRNDLFSKLCDTDDINSALIFDGKNIQGIRDVMESLPRSQIYKILKKPNVEEALNTYQEKTGNPVLGYLPILEGSEERSRDMDLALRAYLWDYVDPFGEHQVSKNEEGE